MGKLNVKWVSDSIGDDYMKWEKGDTILIEAQTGTGKTYFVTTKLLDYLGEGEQLLIVCNRTNLKRQLKRDLLKKYDEKIPETVEELDKLTTIAEKVTITSYHAISDTVKNELYDDGSVSTDFSYFDYVILDECHFIFTDGSFNNKTRFCYEEIIYKYHPHSVKIFISATMNEIRDPIIRCVERVNNNGFGLDRAVIHDYTTGIDYSYVKPNYFENVETIINLIKNDKSDEKWLIFVSDVKNVGAKILEEIGEDDCSIIKSGTESEELDSIINHSKFNKKVLVCTKAMDNGINIKDKQLKNIVIMAWDRISFIQMLGRKRIDIDDPEQVNLYMMTRYKKSFTTKMHSYESKKAEVDLLSEDEKEFNKKYDNDLRDFSGLNEVFYRDVTTGRWKINQVGWKRLLEDIDFAEKMIEAFEADKKFAFIHQQLSWLGLNDPCPDINFIGDVTLEDEVMTLEEYLKNIEGEKLFADEQQELSNLIIRELVSLPVKVDCRTKKLKPSTLESIIRNQLDLPYAVSKSKRETKGEMKRKSYIMITKIK